MLKVVLLGKGKDDRMWIVAETPKYEWVVGHTKAGTVADRKLFKVHKSALEYFLSNVVEVHPNME